MLLLLGYESLCPESVDLQLDNVLPIAESVNSKTTHSQTDNEQNLLSSAVINKKDTPCSCVVQEGLEIKVGSVKRHKDEMEKRYSIGAAADQSNTISSPTKVDGWSKGSVRQQADQFNNVKEQRKSLGKDDLMSSEILLLEHADQSPSKKAVVSKCDTEITSTSGINEISNSSKIELRSENVTQNIVSPEKIEDNSVESKKNIIMEKDCDLSVLKSEEINSKDVNCAVDSEKTKDVDSLVKMFEKKDIKPKSNLVRSQTWSSVRDRKAAYAHRRCSMSDVEDNCDNVQSNDSAQGSKAERLKDNTKTTENASLHENKTLNRTKKWTPYKNIDSKDSSKTTPTKSPSGHKKTGATGMNYVNVNNEREPSGKRRTQKQLHGHTHPLARLSVDSTVFSRGKLVYNSM